VDRPAELLAQLPSFLRHDLAWFLNQQFLEKMPMFNDAGTSALLEINRHLILSVATEGELLAHEGELTREMHFILSGEVHILNDQGRADIELFEGAIIGEVRSRLDAQCAPCIRFDPSRLR
jgi:signal-transduction protein with cAMP-binding, CBS, and nucleotidyltransferase domain